MECIIYNKSWIVIRDVCMMAKLTVHAQLTHHPVLKEKGNFILR